jgi:hypothetical protein
MKRLLTALLIASVALVAQGGTAWGAMSDYVFTQGTGTATDMTGASVAIPAGFSYDDYSVGSISIGFTFKLDGTNYTTAGIGSNGLMVLGGTPQTTAYYNINAASTYPVIAGFWDDHVPSGAGIRYKTTGVAGSRVFTVEWQTYLWYIYTSGSTVVDYTWQVRLYEGTNKIEFLYVSMSNAYTTNGNGQIGASTSNSNYASIANGNPATVSYTSTSQNNLRSTATPISANTLFTLNPCQKNVDIAGVVAQGGTVAMNNGDALFTTTSVQRGSFGTYQPFTTSLGTNPCGSRTVTYAITGTNAADYQITSGGTIGASGSLTPTITFTPSGLGVRTATLTVRDDNGFTRSYTLSATGTTRIQWIGNIAQGGTSTVASGDTLLSSMVVIRNTTASYTPVTVTNFGTNPAALPAPVTATINDPSGQYSIVGPTSASLASGQSYSPVIRFAPTGVGSQIATLTINAEGETRVFGLKAFSAAPGGEFFVNSVKLSPSVGLFINAFGCAGESANTQQLIVNNTGFGDFLINGIDVYRTDTTYGQGVPRYPLSRDRFGNVIPVNDYFITTSPGVAPSSSNQKPQFPIVVPQGQSRTLYITFVSQEPGKRFARAFVRTNGQNFLGTNPAGASVEGLLTFDLFGMGTGSKLSDSRTGGVIKTMTFAPTRVGDSIDVTYRFYNTGTCDLRISFEKLGITSGDVADFRLLNAFGRTIVEGVPMTGDAIINPDSSSTISVRFKPQRNGSRRATLWMQTNDSSVVVNGISERGAYYLDLYGVGKAYLDYSNLKLKPAIIGASVGSSGTVRLVNSSATSVGIQSITIVGGDATQFSRDDASGAWPATPYTILEGGELLLGVKMLPTGAPGGRTTTLRIVTTTGETIDVTITGEAGIQSFSVSPSRLFVGTSIPAGTEARAMVMIANTGTLPIRIISATISGSTDYILGTLPRLVIEPGAVEYLEVTYAPVNPGTSVGTLTIVSDAGTQTVSLEGASTKARRVDPDPTGVVPGIGLTQPELELGMGTTSGVREGAAAGVSFAAVRPNPARERAELVYGLATGADVRLALYDGAGRLVRELATGRQGAGEHRLSVDVTDLTAGVYHCRLTAGAVELTQTLVVVK